MSASSFLKLLATSSNVVIISLLAGVLDVLDLIGLYFLSGTLKRYLNLLAILFPLSVTVFLHAKSSDLYNVKLLAQIISSANIDETL